MQLSQKKARRKNNLKKKKDDHLGDRERRFVVAIADIFVQHTHTHTLSLSLSLCFLCLYFSLSRCLCLSVCPFPSLSLAPPPPLDVHTTHVLCTLHKACIPTVTVLPSQPFSHPDVAGPSSLLAAPGPRHRQQRRGTRRGTHRTTSGPPTAGKVMGQGGRLARLPAGAVRGGDGGGGAGTASQPLDTGQRGGLQETTAGKPAYGPD